MTPIAPPAARPWTRVSTNFGARIMARITREKPLKNRWPSAASATAVNSSNEAPAQNAPVPALRSTMTRASSFAPSAVMAAARSSSSLAGSELLLGCANSTAPTPCATETETVPSGTAGVEDAFFVMRGKIREARAYRAPTLIP